MGRIQSAIGLITGIPIQDTVEQLLKVSAQPRDLLVSRTKDLQAQQTAVAELLAKTLALQIAAKRLGEVKVFEKKTANSSNPDLLSAVATGDPTPGVYQFTPVRTAQAHHLLSAGFAAANEPIGAGSLSFRFGRVVDEAVSLEELNQGQGVERGKIRITDRSGASAEIDLRFVQTIDEVLDAINDADAINVTAAAVGDRIQLTDETGQTTFNLRVQEVGGGQTAADLGLAGINVAASQALGSDLLSLHVHTALAALNDGAGVDISGELADLDIRLRDGTTLTIDFHRLANEEDFDGGAAQAARTETTLGELLETINQADPTRLRAEISADGDRIVLTDLSADAGGTFAVSNPFGGRTAETLGLTGAASGGVITGRRLLGGLQTSLLSSLNGGQGLELGLLDLTDRAGASATVDLSSAETLDDVVTAIDAANVAITARVNNARNGLVLIDESGGSGNLIVANGDGSTGTADKLKIAVNDAVASVNSGSLHLQTVSRQTRLDSLNGGRGVANGSFLIYNSNGVARSLNPSTSEIETVGELIDLINASGLEVTARINDAGDGIALIDTAGGTESLRVQEVGSGTTARDLHLLRDAVETTEDGDPAQLIDGSTAVTVTLDEDDTLQDLAAKINAAGGGAKASIFSSGSGSRPHRLSLVSEATGLAGRLVVDASEAGFDVHEVSSARDALLAFGSSQDGAGVLVSSSENTFDDLIDGLSLTVKGASADPVAISVDTTDADVVSNVKTFVEQYNALVKKIDEFTFFNAVDDKVGVLFGSNEALRLETDLASLATGRFFGAGSIQSLAEVGINVKDDGTLELNQEKLQARFAADAAAVEEFFTTETTGFAAKFDRLIETLAGEGSSLLVDRSAALTRKVELNQERIAFFDGRLARERERLLKQFYDMEAIIGKMQVNLNAVAALQPLPPLTSNNDSF